MKYINLFNIVTEKLSLYGKKNSIVGFDEYCKVKQLEYPEVYSRLALSYYYIYKIDGNNIWKKKALDILDKLLYLSQEDDDTICWGLPFDWGTTKSGSGFLITTVFSLQALIMWEKEEENKYSNIIKKGIKWCFDLLHDDDILKEKAFYYSPNLKVNIYNATSLACAILYDCKKYLTELQKQNLISVAKGIVKAQNEKGFWKYSKSNYTVDLLHQAYTCEGLLLLGNNLKYKNQEPIVSSAIKGVSFMDKFMFKSEIERYLYKLTDKVEFRIKCKFFILKFIKLLNLSPKRFKLVRAWSYGAYLRTHLLLENYYNYKSMEINSYQILKIIKNNILENGNFKFNKHDESIYIRHQAHMLYSLSQYLYFKERQNYE